MLLRVIAANESRIQISTKISGSSKEIINNNILHSNTHTPSGNVHIASFVCLLLLFRYGCNKSLRQSKTKVTKLNLQKIQCLAFLKLNCLLFCVTIKKNRDKYQYIFLQSSRVLSSAINKLPALISNLSPVNTKSISKTVSVKHISRRRVLHILLESNSPKRGPLPPPCYLYGISERHSQRFSTTRTENGNK